MVDVEVAIEASQPQPSQAHKEREKISSHDGNPRFRVSILQDSSGDGCAVQIAVELAEVSHGGEG